MQAKGAKIKPGEYFLYIVLPFGSLSLQPMDTDPLRQSDLIIVSSMTKTPGYNPDQMIGEFCMNTGKEKWIYVTYTSKFSSILEKHYCHFETIIYLMKFSHFSCDHKEWWQCARPLLPLGNDLWPLWVSEQSPGQLWTDHHSALLPVTCLRQLFSILQYLRRMVRFILV